MLTHRYILVHGHAGAVLVWSGPWQRFESAKRAMVARLAEGHLTYIADQWYGWCDTCGARIVCETTPYQCACGQQYTLDRPARLV